MKGNHGLSARMGVKSVAKNMPDKFSPQTPFEGFVKAQIEELFRAIEDINGIKDDLILLKVEVTKKIGSLEGKISGVKGWMAGISIAFGFLGGLVAVILRTLLIK